MGDREGIGVTATASPPPPEGDRSLPGSGDGEGSGPRHASTRARRTLLWLAVAALGASVWATGWGREPLVNAGGWEQLQRFFAAALHPELDPTFLRLTLDSTFVTVGYALLGTALSVGIGLVGGMLATRAWADSAVPGGVGRIGRGIVRSITLPLRSVHEAVWAVVLITILGLDPLVAILAIGVPFGAVTAKVYADIFDELPRGPFLALRAAGVGRPAAFLYGVVPAALRSLVSYGFYRFECSIRAAAVLGVIGAGGLGFQIRLSFQSLNYNEMWTLIAALVILCGIADSWGSALRDSQRGGRDVRVQRWMVGASLVAMVVALVLAWRHLDVDPSSLRSSRARLNLERFVAVYNFGVLGRLLAEMVEQQDDRSTEVLRAGGASSTQRVLYDRAPRLATPFLAYGVPLGGHHPRDRGRRPGRRRRSRGRPQPAAGRLRLPRRDRHPPGPRHHHHPRRHRRHPGPKSRPLTSLRPTARVAE